MTVPPAPDSTVARAPGPTASPESAGSTAEQSGSTSLRQMLEAIVCLAVAVIIFRAFVLEGYIISTGSMAPSLLGYHKQVQCPDCGFSFAFGFSDSLRDDPASQVANCPNCRMSAIDVTDVPRNDGDQLLVLKNAWLSEFSPFLQRVGPNRWDVVVFLNPNDPSQAYVKRAIGLPGESVQIRDGDILINGKRQRKSIETQRAIRVPVFDNDFPSDSPDWRPCWVDDAGRWQPSGRGFVAAAPGPQEDTGPARPGRQFSWLSYYHWSRATRPITATLRQPAPLLLGPVMDQYGYNRRAARLERIETHDLMLTARLDWESGAGAVAATIRTRGAQIACLIDPASHTLSVYYADENTSTDLESQLSSDIPGGAGTESRIAQAPIPAEWPIDLEFSVFDRQVTVAVNENVVIEKPLPRSSTDADWPGAVEPDFAVAGRVPPIAPAPTYDSPVRIGVLNGTVRVDSLRLYRDVHYTAEAGQHATRDPLKLGDDEFFMLGDNSPVSLDSRSWPDPVVPRHLLIGKPLVVHLPSRPGRLRIGDRVCHIRVPDFSRMRYIR